MSDAPSFPGSCPFPIENYPTVQMAHGGGGRLMGQLIERMFLEAFGAPERGEQHDSAVLRCEGARLAFTTDSFVVRPLVFPGGNLGSLAVHGTVNDLAVGSSMSRASTASPAFSRACPTSILMSWLSGAPSSSLRA